MMLSIISLNVNGLRTASGIVSKRRRIFTWLKRQTADIFFIQETHSEKADETYWLNEWGGQGYFSHGDCRSRGVAILFRPGFKVEIHNIERDVNGRFLVLGAEIGAVHCTLATVYGPNCDNPNTFESFLNAVECLSLGETILGGDFNFYFDKNLDKISGRKRSVNNDKCRQMVESFAKANGLVDIWRKVNPMAKKFTYERNNPVSKSRIDFFLTDESLLLRRNQAKADIRDAYLADHKMITLEVDLGKTTQGKSYWKFNSSLLEDEGFVNLIKDKIRDTIINNDSPELSRCLLLQTVLCVLRGYIIAYASRKKREKEQYLKDLDRKINLMQDRANPGSHELALLKRERDNFVETLAKRNIFHCKTRWRQFAEKGSKYFHSLGQTKGGGVQYKLLELSITKPGTTSEDISDMLAEGSAYFNELYRGSKMQGDGITFFDNIPVLNPEEGSRCEGEITEGELHASLVTMSNGSSPGPDGFNASFYKFFWSELKQLITAAAKEMFEEGKIPLDIKASITILLPKKGKDRSRLASLRPISLLNTVYKMITKVIARRIGLVIRQVVNEDQSGFLKGRFIGENGRLIIDVMNDTKEHNTPGLILFCDFKMAYDSVNWQYLQTAIRSFGFGPCIRRWINILYNENQPSQARVQINGHLSEPYCISKGLRQGCPLSCLLFLLCIEPLAHSIRENTNIRGINFGPTEVKLSCYADDMAVILNGSEQSLRSCVARFNEFEKVSGLTLNKAKTRAVWIGKFRNRFDQICPDLCLSWGQDHVKYLGLTLNPMCENLAEINYDEKIQAIKQRLNVWVRRGLTPYGRIHLIKSEALGQLVYLMTVLEKPNAKQRKCIETILFRFIWGNRNDKIKRTTMKNTYEAGGFKVPDIAVQADSLKISWVKKYLDDGNKAKWKDVMKGKLELHPELTLFHCNSSEKQVKERLKDPFWIETVLSWQRIANLDGVTGQSILSNPIWMNQNINVEQNPTIQRRKFIRKGILRVMDLYDTEQRRIMNDSQLRGKFPGIHFLHCRSLLASIPTNWKEVLSRERPSRASEPVAFSQLAKASKVARWAYRYLIKQTQLTTPTKAHLKWSRELGMSPEEIDFNKIYRDIYFLTNDFKLRWLGLQILHRILPTNRLLQIYGIIDDGNCTFCTCSETLSHLFYDCPLSRQFWMCLKRKLNLSEHFCLFNVITGFVDVNEGQQIRTVKMLVLLGKQFLWSCRVKKIRPTYDGFRYQLENYLKVEKFIAVSTGKDSSFEEMWANVIRNIRM